MVRRVPWIMECAHSGFVRFSLRALPMQHCHICHIFPMKELERPVEHLGIASIVEMFPLPRITPMLPNDRLVSLYSSLSRSVSRPDYVDLTL
ncbi:hypothetical protein RRG08_051350 [Elysia crispata]|uniref:Uncharacterized protein n=1 Tax=Elysia crispata TaxID=231223 RepID=A0AAE1E9P1_9GAST|nr:hypothetical protein RRG08_051350 [Elysia crispata]